MSAKKTQYQLPTEDHEKLKKLLGREPETLEIVLALALWNEHCSYRSSKKHLKKFQFSTTKNISALGEQAGIIDLGQGERVSFKMESHNHPSFIVPYHGSATGIGGILRDIFAMNARPIALADYLCFGAPEAEGNAGRVDGVVRGIGDYGNCIGIPTVTGHTEFLSSYNRNILVNAMALGYMDSKTKAMDSKARGVGNYVVYVGSSTGRDGILGADMASRSFGEDKESAKPTVQIGDPFFGKQLMEACLLAMEQELVVACQDMGAAGLTCSSFEMADKGNLGLSLHLDRVPLRDKSLQPEEILLSESQERMLFICEPSQWKKLKTLFEDHQLEICILGEVLQHKEMELFWKGQKLLKADPKLWTSHAPVEDRPYVFPEPAQRVLPREFTPLPKAKNLLSREQSFSKIKKILLKVLSSPNGLNRKFIYSQYDQRVGIKTIKDSAYPFAVLNLPESERELGIAMGCRPYLMALDTEQGAKDAVFYPALQLALRGFKPWAVTDCLNFGNPEKKEIMGEFVLSVESIAKACEILDTPVVSGNVSFYNESQGKNITPTPSIAMIGLKEDNRSLPDIAFKKAGERVYLLSSHQFWFQGAFKDFLPKSQSSSKAYGALQDPLVHCFAEQIFDLSQQIQFSSARLVGKFGIAYTLARMVLGNGIGFSLKETFPFPLLQERLYEVIVSIAKEEEKRFKESVKHLALDWTFMGETQEVSNLVLQGEKISYQEISKEYLQSWKGLSL